MYTAITKFVEKAVSIAEAEIQNLALAIWDHNDSRSFALYSPTVENILAFGEITKKGRRPFGAWQVKATAAVKGYGPLLYDIMLHYKNPTGLYPDREAVSLAAQNVWRYYFQNRSDVAHFPIDDIEYPVTPSKKDDAPIHDIEAEYPHRDPIDFVYKAEMQEEFDTLRQSHKDWVAQLPAEKQTGFLRELYIRGLQFASNAILESTKVPMSRRLPLRRYTSVLPFLEATSPGDASCVLAWVEGKEFQWAGNSANGEPGGDLWTEISKGLNEGNYTSKKEGNPKDFLKIVDALAPSLAHHEEGVADSLDDLIYAADFVFIYNPSENKVTFYRDGKLVTVMVPGAEAPQEPEPASPEENTPGEPGTEGEQPSIETALGPEGGRT